jgi:histidine triad (HIT) family protein
VSSPCAFCDIVSGRSQADVVYEDSDAIGFLPLRLQAYGHTLLVPRRHVAALWEMTDADLAGVMRAARELSARWRKTLSATGFNLLHASGPDAQQSVPHFHLHLLPRFPADGLDAWPDLPEVKAERSEWVRVLRA